MGAGSMTPEGSRTVKEVLRQMRKMASDFEKKGPLHSLESIKKVEKDLEFLAGKISEIIRADRQRRERKQKVIPMRGKDGR